MGGGIPLHELKALGYSLSTTPQGFLHLTAPQPPPHLGTPQLLSGAGGPSVGSGSVFSAGESAADGATLSAQPARGGVQTSTAAVGGGVPPSSFVFLGLPQRAQSVPVDDPGGPLAIASNSTQEKVVPPYSVSPSSGGLTTPVQLHSPPPLSPDQAAVVSALQQQQRQRGEGDLRPLGLGRATSAVLYSTTSAASASAAAAGPSGRPRFESWAERLADLAQTTTVEDLQKAQPEHYED
mmetsp:Transcript_4138/g.8422  ORF Transcript_4138/g.8422 Transcript_4138/m.8422 type:complete len:238 (+) Transcript_4138:1-714(+)